MRIRAPLKHHRGFATSSGLALAGLCGCASIPRGGAAIDSVQIVGARAVDEDDVTSKLATTESQKFLGLLQGVAYDYSIYDPSVLQRDLARVERYYRGRGFFDAHVRVARIVHTNADHVRIEIAVDEGKPVLSGEVRIGGLDGLPIATADAVRLAANHALPRGKRFDENAYRDAQAAALRALTDRGYAYATVHAEAQVDLATHTIDYAFLMTPRIPVVYGPLSFVGLDPDGAGPRPQEIEEPLLRRVMDIREGAPYSTAEIDAATQALLDLEVFSAVQIEPKLSDPPKPVVPLLVQVEPTRLRAVRLGIGAEFDAVKTDAHARFGWEDHNFLGGLRDFAIDLKPGVDFYPTSTSNFRGPNRYFYDQHLRVQFRQPGFLEHRTTGFVRPELNVYPLLVDPNPTDSESVVNYIEPKASVGLERRFGEHLLMTFAYNFQGEKPFTYPGQPLDPSLPTVLLSFPQIVAQLDFRDDVVHPHAGFIANADLQFAGIGGTARDVRIQPDAAAYIPIARGVTFAVSATLGLLFPLNYGDKVTGLPVADPSTPDPNLDRDIETVYFRGFFSGGPNSNRGYPLRGVAPHGYIPFLNPATARTQVANSCNPSKSTSVGNPLCSSPIGGFTQWELSAEVRFTVSGPLGAAIFCDAGDVSQHVLFHEDNGAGPPPSRRALRFDYLHMSCGVGARYDTPVGPIRLDVGYRIPPLQVLGFPNETAAAHADPTLGTAPRIFGQPIAVAFGIGESF
jgi:outer membrane protein insertion porin family/translocation and assembly module TamA